MDVFMVLGVRSPNEGGQGLSIMWYVSRGCRPTWAEKPDAGGTGRCWETPALVFPTPVQASLLLEQKKHLITSAALTPSVQETQPVLVGEGAAPRTRGLVKRVKGEFQPRWRHR